MIIDIVQTLNKYLQLKKIGNNYVALCPFHKEKTASFTINPIKQFFYCFGCKINGNAETFLNLYTTTENKKNFINAQTHKIIKTFPENYLKKLKLFKKINLISIFELQKKKIKEHYCLQRKIPFTIIKKFSLGYLPEINVNSFLTKYNVKKTIKILKNRVIIPIKNIFGIIISFSGRTTRENIKPKYINTKNTKFFKKIQHLFGLHEYITYSHQLVNNLIIVEGFFDVLSLITYNINNVVATIGTILSKSQLNKIYKHCNKIFFCYDNDFAGNLGYTKNKIKILNSIYNSSDENKIIIKKIKLPVKLDPDIYIKTFGKKKFENLLK